MQQTRPPQLLAQRVARHLRFSRPIPVSRARIIELFIAVGVATALIRSLVIPGFEQRAIPLVLPGEALGRVAVALLWWGSLILPLRRPTPLSWALFTLGNLIMLPLVTVADRPAAFAVTLAFFLRHRLRLEQTVLITLVISVLGSVIYSLGMGLYTYRNQFEQITSLVLINITQVMFMYATFELALGLHQKREDLRASVQRLQAYRALELQNMAFKEKTRLARELHDTLGHHLTVLRLEAQKSRKIIERDGVANEELRRSVELTIARSGDSLRQLLEVVSTLKTAELDGTLGEALRSLVANAPSVVHLEVEEDGVYLPVERSVALYRGMQEALTNAYKHAPGRPIRARLWRDGSSLRLRVGNPCLPATRAPEASGVIGSGQGLLGLRQRLREVGGELELSSTEETFELCLTVPIPQ